MDFSKFCNKYMISGSLKMESIHIGSGKAEGEADAPTIRYNNGLAYIPGSSFRGHLRAKLEGVTELGLMVDGRDIDRLDIMGIFGYTNLSKDNQEELYDRIGVKSSSMAGKIHISDLKIVENKKDRKRDGIAIDRNTGTTKNGAKFDYNVLEDVEFNLEISLENLEDYELDLVNIGLNMIKNDIFGGKTSRGIGRSELEINEVKYVEKENLKDYLFKGKMKTGTQEILEKNKITL